MNVQAPAAAAVEARTDRLVARLAEQRARLPARHEPPERALPHRLHRHQRRLHRHPRRAPLPHRLPLRGAGRGPGARLRARRGGPRTCSATWPGACAGGRASRTRDLSVAKHAQARGEARRRGPSSWPAGDARGGAARGEGRAPRSRRCGAATELADAAYRDMQERGLVGRTEREVAITATRAMVDLGAEGPSFPPIVAAGAAGALPHAVPRDVEIPPGVLVVVDMGAQARRLLLGLHAHVRHRSARRRRARGLRAGAARAGGGPGRRARGRRGAGGRRGGARRSSRRRATASASATASGTAWGSRCTRGRGWRKTASGSLEAGNAVTVEPGVYLPGELGVRIEDLVVVTDGRARGAHRVSQGPRNHGLIVLAGAAALARRARAVGHGLRLRAGAEPRAVRGARSLRGGHHDAAAGPAAQRAGAARLGPPRGARGAAGADAAWRRCRGWRWACWRWRCSRSPCSRWRWARRWCWRPPGRCTTGRGSAAPAAGGRARRLGGGARERGAHHLDQHQRPADRAVAGGAADCGPAELRASLAASFLALNLAGGVVVVVAGGTGAVRLDVLAPLLVLTLVGHALGMRAFRRLAGPRFSLVALGPGGLRRPGEPGGGAGCRCRARA